MLQLFSVLVYKGAHGLCQRKNAGLESLKTGPQAWKTIFRAARFYP